MRPRKHDVLGGPLLPLGLTTSISYQKVDARMGLIEHADVTLLQYTQRFLVIRRDDRNT